MKYYTNDCNILLGNNLKLIEGVLFSKLLKVIWIQRCKRVFEKDKLHTNLITHYKYAINSFLSRERERLDKETFKAIYIPRMMPYVLLYVISLFSNFKCTLFFALFVCITFRHDNVSVI